jgi:protein-tyrosine-phosphatase
MANDSTSHSTELAQVVDRLAAQYAGTFDRATVTRFVESSYDQLAGTASTMAFVPLLAERFARQRLDAAARNASPEDGAPPVVLFLCVHNAGRSQMALGWLNHLAHGRAVGWSGGSEPGNEVNPSAVKAMAEVGIDITGEFPKPWTEEIVRAADVVVTMGCGDTCPYYPGTRYVDWQLDDPAGMGVEAVRPIRDAIRAHVESLLTELGIPRG